ncbi:MAG TPA: hypothetical protein VGL66_17950 [Caulobacteraceae bacterium]|jgi:preprotein translocase subunit SecD
MKSKAGKFLTYACGGAAAVAAIVSAPIWLPDGLVVHLPSATPTYDRSVDVEDSGGARVDLKVDETALRQSDFVRVQKRAIDALKAEQIDATATAYGDLIFVRITDPQKTDRAMELLLKPETLHGAGEFGVTRGGDGAILLTFVPIETYDEAVNASARVLLRRAKAMGYRFAAVSLPTPGVIRVDAPGASDLKGLVTGLTAKAEGFPAPLIVVGKRIVDAS